MSDGIDDVLRDYIYSYRDIGLSIVTTEDGKGWAMVDDDGVVWSAVRKSDDDQMDHLLLVNQYDTIEEVSDAGYTVERILVNAASPWACLGVALISQETGDVIMRRAMEPDEDLADVIADMIRGIAARLMMDAAADGDA